MGSFPVLPPALPQRAALSAQRLAHTPSQMTAPQELGEVARSRTRPKSEEIPSAREQRSVPVLGAQFRVGAQAPVLKSPSALSCPGCAALSSKLARMKAEARDEAAALYHKHESACAQGERAALLLREAEERLRSTSARHAEQLDSLRCDAAAAAERERELQLQLRLSQESSARPDDVRLPREEDAQALATAHQELQSAQRELDARTIQLRRSQHIGQQLTEELEHMEAHARDVAVRVDSERAALKAALAAAEEALRTARDEAQATALEGTEELAAKLRAAATEIDQLRWVVSRAAAQDPTPASHAWIPHLDPTSGPGSDAGAAGKAWRGSGRRGRRRRRRLWNSAAHMRPSSSCGAGSALPLWKDPTG